MRLGLGWVAVCLTLNACSSSSGGGGSGGGGIDCAVCNVVQFDCAVGSGDGQATIAGTDARGCFGTIGSAGETSQLWIRCDTSQICVEHDDECFKGTGNAVAFSYDIPNKGTKVTCTAR
jgi:hypothetical protein